MSSPGVMAGSVANMVWHHIVKADGTSASVLSPKGFFMPDSPLSPDSGTLFGAQKATSPRDLDSETTETPSGRPLSLPFPSAGLGPLLPSSLASDISHNSTYSPRKPYDTEGSYELASGAQRPSISGTTGIAKVSNSFSTGFASPSPWNDTQNQSWGRQGFGGQTPRSHKARDQSMCSPWAGPYSPTATSPILTGTPPGLPGLPMCLSPQPSQNSANFERWCRNRLLEDKLNTLAANVEVSTSLTPLHSPHTIGDHFLNAKLLLPPPADIEPERTPEKAKATFSREEGEAISEQVPVMPEFHSEAGETEDGKGEGDRKEHRGPFNRRCRYINIKGGCREGADCPYNHSPSPRKRTQSPKKELVDNSDGTGPRAIITRGMSSGEQKDETKKSSASKESTSPVRVDPPQATILPSNQFNTILQRPNASTISTPGPSLPVQAPRILTPPITPSQAATTSPSVPTTNHNGISADMTDLDRPKGVKEFCTYWFRTGRCDFFNQQGCAYSHDKDAYYAKYPLRPAPAAPPVLRERSEEPLRNLSSSKWANKGLGEVKLTIITKTPLPSPLFSGKGASPTKKSWAAEKRHQAAPAASPAPTLSSKKGRVGTLARKVVIRGATVNFANTGRWPRGEKVPGATSDEETCLSSEEVEVVKPSAAPKLTANENAKAAIDDASLSRPWNKVHKKPVKSTRGKGKGSAKDGKGGREGDLLMPWIESQTKVGIESQTGMKVDVGDLLGMDDGSVAGSVLELKRRK